MDKRTSLAEAVLRDVRFERCDLGGPVDERPAQLAGGKAPARVAEQVEEQRELHRIEQTQVGQPRAGARGQPAAGGDQPARLFVGGRGHSPGRAGEDRVVEDGVVGQPRVRRQRQPPVEQVVADHR